MSWTHHVRRWITALSSALLLVVPTLAHGQAVTAAWDPSPPADQVTGYQVCVGTASLSCNVALAPVSASTTTYRFTPAGGTLYYVAARATNAAGASPYSSEVRFSIPSFAQPANQTSTAGSPIAALSLSIADPDGSPITITHTGLPVDLKIDSAQRRITGTPSAAAAGTYNVTLFVNDGLVTVSRSFTWTITSGTVGDATAPALTITSHTSGQTVTTSSVTITGAATDSARGGSGITQVRVNGLTATGGAATGSNMANWSRAVTLTNGANAITVEATDGAGNVSMQQITLNMRRSAGDFDGDGRADMWRYLSNSAGTWRIRASSTATYTNYQWGVGGDLPVPADYDGDGRIDPAVYRPSAGQWWILPSTTNYTSASVHSWGLNGDVPVPADFDGDGRADLIVYRPSTGQWWILRSTTNYRSASVYYWGLNGDIPVAADFDGDGRVDLAVYRPSTGQWWVRRSTTSYSYASTAVYQWGISGDVPVAADYDGDGRADMMVYRPSAGQWWILKSSTNYSYAGAAGYQWGISGDVPRPADYDGDGRVDIAVWRASEGLWYILKSSTNFTSWVWYQWQ